MSDNITHKYGTNEQTISFHFLSEDTELAFHEILDRLFRELTNDNRTAELGWLRGKYG